jgi:hypothetical protein
VTVVIRIAAETDASVEEVVAGACDLSGRRARIWPNRTLRGWFAHAGNRLAGRWLAGMDLRHALSEIEKSTR